MSFNADALTLTLLALLAVLIVGILAYAGSIRMKSRRTQRDIALVRAAIIEYFRRSGVQVSADCTTLEGNRRFTVVVESEPMKRFRLSHIIEMTLREHVRKTCGQELDKVYWRFPIKEAEQAVMPASATGQPKSAQQVAAAAASEAGATQNPDDYINEGLEHYRHIPKPEVTELDWEAFQEFANTTDREKKDPQQGQ